jgi:hypothetical protein
MGCAAGQTPGHEKPAHMRIVERRGGCVGANVAFAACDFNKNVGLAAKCLILGIFRYPNGKTRTVQKPTRVLS